MEEVFMNINEVAKMLKTSVRAVREISTDNLPKYRPMGTRRLLYKRSEVLEFIEKGKK